MQKAGAPRRAYIVQRCCDVRRTHGFLAESVTSQRSTVSQALVSEGTELGLKLERLGTAQTLLQAANRWSQRACYVLDAATEAGQSSGSEVCRPVWHAIHDVSLLATLADVWWKDARERGII